MITIEWYKQVRRRRTYLALGVAAAFAVVLAIALDATGAAQSEFVGDLPLILVPRSSGLSVPLIALSSTMKFLLPLAVALFAGEAVAGDAAWGNLRYVLARPGSRARVLWSKAAVAGLLSLATLLILTLLALVAGGLAYGWHPLRVTDGSNSTPGHPASVVVAGATVVGHLGVGVLYIGAGMTSIFAVAFFLSCVTRRPVVAVAGGVALTVVSRIFNADYFPGIRVVNRYMPNNDIDLWQHLFTRSPDLSGVPHFLVLQAVYAVVFLTLAHWWFTRKDILD